MDKNDFDRQMTARINQANIDAIMEINESDYASNQNHDEPNGRLNPIAEEKNTSNSHSSESDLESVNSFHTSSFHTDTSMDGFDYD